MLKRVLKYVLRGVSLAVVFPSVSLCGFGRWAAMFEFFATGYAVVPGILGDFLRIAFYRFTLEECSLQSRVSFGTFFAHRQARLGKNVYIGSYCIIGRASIGDRTQIASGVQILSGRHQHARGPEGRISGADESAFIPVSIGADCWLGAAAVIMADVGAHSTIGAGSVVSRAIPAGSIAVGSPARVIKSTADN